MFKVKPRLAVIVIVYTLLYPIRVLIFLFTDSYTEIIVGGDIEEESWNDWLILICISICIINILIVTITSIFN